MNTKTFAALAFATAMACGGNNEDNSQTNNTSTNNTNNTSTNNTNTNNTNTNNTNNTNNTVSNRFGVSGECRRVNFEKFGKEGAALIFVEQGGTPSFDRSAFILDRIAGYTGTEVIVVDNDADGEFDEGWRTTYDADGRELTRDIDIDGDGSFDDQRWEFTYDADGNQLSWVVTDSEGGELIRHKSTYDAEGRLLTREEDGVEGRRQERPDGEPHYIETRAYVGDVPSLIQVDADGDGRLEMKLTVEFDENDKATFRTRDGHFDFATRTVIRPMDGIPDEEETFIRNADGTIQRLESDGDVGPNREQADGTIDLIQRNFEFNAEGKFTYLEQDGRTDVTNDITTQAADGTFDSITMTWNADGKRTSWILDEGIDGTDDVIITDTYDEDGQPAMRRRDGGIDNDELVTEQADGTDNWIQEFSWYAPEYLTSHTVDDDADDSPEFIHEREYVETPHGTFETLRRVDGGHWYNEITGGANGNWNAEFKWSYDEQGRPLSETIDLGYNPYTSSTWEYGPCSDFL